MRVPGANRVQFSLGFLCLTAGSLEYVFRRPPGSTVFLSAVQPLVSTLHGTVDLYGRLGDVAPAFFHPLGFALMTMALLPPGRSARWMICSAWLALDSAMELAQLAGHRAASWVPSWFERIPILENLNDFLVRGTFDVYDLAAGALGAATALGLGKLTEGGFGEPAAV